MVAEGQAIHELNTCVSQFRNAELQTKCHAHHVRVNNGVLLECIILVFSAFVSKNSKLTT